MITKIIAIVNFAHLALTSPPLTQSPRWHTASVWPLFLIFYHKPTWVSSHCIDGNWWLSYHAVCVTASHGSLPRGQNLLNLPHSQLDWSWMHRHIKVSMCALAPTTPTFAFQRQAEREGTSPGSPGRPGGLAHPALRVVSYAVSPGPRRKTIDGWF